MSAQFLELEREGLFVTACTESDWLRFRELVGETEVILHLLEPLTSALIALAPKLRLIQKIGVGVNTIDLEAARRREIAVCNMPGTNSRAVAEMTLLLMLSVLRQVCPIDRLTRRGEGWKLPATAQDLHRELGGTTVGLVGYGAVARLLAPMLQAVGARVIYTSRSHVDDAVAEERSLDDLLSESDLVSLHLPLNLDTEKIINEHAITRMKQHAVLINTARGALVDEVALYRALQSGALGGAGLDVFEEEPTSPENPLFTLDNVVVSPHVAYLTRETIERSLAVAAENCRRLAANKELLYRVV